MTTPVPLDNIKTIVDNWRTARAKEAEWKQAKEELAAVIAQCIGDHEIGTIDGVPALSLKALEENRLNYNLLKQRHPDIYAECCETTEKSSGLRIVG